MNKIEKYYFNNNLLIIMWMKWPLEFVGVNILEIAK